MILLLDTHTLLWFLRDDPLLSIAAKSLIEDIPLVSVDGKFDAYPVTRLW